MTEEAKRETPRSGELLDANNRTERNFDMKDIPGEPRKIKPRREANPLDASKTSGSSPPLDGGMIAFLRHVLPEAGNGWYCSFDLATKANRFHETINELAAELAEIDGKGHDAYFAIATFKDPSGGRTKANVQAVRTIALDLDCGEGHRHEDQSSALLELDVIGGKIDLPLGGAVKVNSGYGVHVHFPLDRALARWEWEPLALGVKEACLTAYMAIDPTVTGDAARILRAPGLHNFKNGVSVETGLVPGSELNFRIDASRLEKFTADASQRTERAKAEGDTLFTDEAKAFYRDLVMHLDPSMGRESWLKVGMALHALGAEWDEWSLDLWDEWSSEGRTYHGRDDLEKDWSGFDRDHDGGVTPATLFHMAKEAGWKGQVPASISARIFPSKPPSERFPAVAALPFDGGGVGEAEENAPAAESEAGLLATYSLETVAAAETYFAGFTASERESWGGGILRLWDLRFAVVMAYGGRRVVIDTTKPDPTPIDADAWARHHSGPRIAPKNGGAALIASRVWLQGTERRFSRMELDPSKPPEFIVGRERVLNLWRGFAVESKAGDWSKLRHHIDEVIASGDEKLAGYIVKWMAWGVQNPGRPAEVALIFRGKEGTGKGTLAKAYLSLFGAQHSFSTGAAERVTGRFNSQLDGALFVFLDEARVRFDQRDGLYSIITEGSIVVERKGYEPITVRNRLKFMMASNHDLVVPAGPEARRFVVCDVSDRYAYGAAAGRDAYFRELHREIENGGPAAMLHGLLAMDLKGWHPSQIVETKALAEQKQTSMPRLDAWFWSLVEDGALPRDYDRTFAGKDRTVSAQRLLDAAKEEAPDLTSTKIGRFLTKHGCVHVRTELARGWQLPSLSELRAKGAKSYGFEYADGSQEWGGPSRRGDEEPATVTNLDARRRKPRKPTEDETL